MLDPDTYQLRADGLMPKVDLRPSQTWPQVMQGSRIEIAGTFGGDCPQDVKHAMLLLIGEDGTTRANAARPVYTAVDALLANHRRGAW